MADADIDNGDGSDFAIVQRAVVRLLHALESAQQTILFQDVGAAQLRLQNAVAETFTEARRALARIIEHPAHALLQDALDTLELAGGMFLARRTWPDYAMAYLSSRTQQVGVLERLYNARDTLPLVEPYFRLAGTPPVEQPANPAAGTGISHHGDPSAGGEYSLYVPETREHNENRPLIVCLHGSHGRGDEYLWTWLRAGRTHGAVILAPKSSGPTWSMMQPERDGEAILAMIDATCARYAIDRDRILLTGLSDGGTFAYLLGFGQSSRFAACAPIAGVLSPAAERLLRDAQGRELPLHVVHGAHDAIFPVQSVRRTNALLESLHYDLTYTELPDWGHALTNNINETIVWPWFEALPR